MVQSYKGLKEAGKYGTVGLELILSMAVGYWLGHKADGKWFGGHGYATVVGSLLGVYAGFRTLWLATKRANREAEQAEREARSGKPQEPYDGDS